MAESGVVANNQLRTRSLRRRVTVIVLAFLAAMILLLAITTDRVLSARLEGQLETRLTDRARVAQALVDQVEPQDLVNRLAGDGVSVRLTTTDGKTYAKGDLSGATVPQPSAGPVGPGPGPGPAERDAPVVRSGELLTVATTLTGGSNLALIVDATEVRRTLDQVRIALAVGGVLVLLLAALVLGPVVTRVLRPLNQITATAADIAAGDRGRRLRPDRPDTELGRTAAAFDDMLDTVEGAEASARAAEQRQREFLADAAHELRTPIAAVTAAAEQLVRGAHEREVTERVSVTVVREARRAGRLVDDLLTTARLDAGVPLERRPVELTGVVRSVAQAVGLGRPGAGIDVQGEPFQLVADPDRIAQVLTNLVVNAVTAAGPAARVDLTIGAEGPWAVVTVTDSGPGVAPADAERIFERLVRLDLARTRTDTAGSGLGLTIARAIARAHGGDVVCVPRPPAPGGCFRLLLPR